MRAMSSPKKKKNSGGRPPVSKPKRPITSFRGSPEFQKWFDGLAKHVRLQRSTLIEHALVEYARNHGYDDPAPDR